MNRLLAALFLTLASLASSAEPPWSRVHANVQSIGVNRMGLTGNGVTVAVLDTGVDAVHPDLRDVVRDEACFCVNAKNEPCCPDGTTRQIGPGAARDDNGHGTHLSGIIAGRGRVASMGLAPGAYIVAVKIADRSGFASTWAMLAALDWIATAQPDVQVVNMSLGTAATYPGRCDDASPINRELAAVAQVLKGRGALIVAASGNAGQTNRMSAPACVSGFFSVGAVHTQNNRMDDSNGCIDHNTAENRMACFSNRSSVLSILAPGAGIVSSNVGGGEAVGSGTSQAAAVVSGAAALLMQGAPQRDGSCIEDALRESGTMVADDFNHRAIPRLDTRAAFASLGR